MIKTLKRFLGQSDGDDANPENLLAFDPRTPPSLPQGAHKISRHMPMDPNLRMISLMNGIALEIVKPGETIADVVARVREPLADATILDALMFARLTGKIWFPMHWQDRFIVFAGTVFQGPSWNKVVPFLNLVDSDLTASMRGLRNMHDATPDEHSKTFVAHATPEVRTA
ncbi:MAG TPA: hypothetical protein VLB83_01985 [Candidatus Paceibacterota bacterium]|nr:hypothetical protein [Candidatus Paceibacterota bacterium]